jgi:xanthine/uracil/vitamin C permease (AzgA family)
VLRFLFVKVGSFEFSLGELAGSMGDFGTLFPLAIGYIAVCGLNPAGLFVMMGLANIATGLAYRLPMPIEPMKVLAAVAITQRWSPSMVYASAFGMGAIWLIFGVTGIIGWIARATPNAVIRGIQVALGVLLAIQAFKMVSTGWALGIVSILVVVALRHNRYAPAPIVLLVLGVVIMLAKGQLHQVAPPGLSFPAFSSFRIEEVWHTFLLAGFAQIPLTATNAVIATSSLIKTYWPDRTVGERHLSLNMGIMNLSAPFFGGMPICHGGGGLAAQYYFGARTGGPTLLRD